LPKLKMPKMNANSKDHSKLRTSTNCLLIEKTKNNFLKKLFDGYFFFMFNEERLQWSCYCLQEDILHSMLPKAEGVPYTSATALHQVTIDLFGPLPTSVGSNRHYNKIYLSSHSKTRHQSLLYTCSLLSLGLIDFPKLCNPTMVLSLWTLLSSAIVYKTCLNNGKLPSCHPEANGAAERHVGLSETLMWASLLLVV
jgi:hypothetical protein